MRGGRGNGLQEGNEEYAFNTVKTRTWRSGDVD